MSEPDTKLPGGNQLLEEAAAWFARMRGPEAEASREDFEAWLARGALHRRAYNRASEIFAMGKLLAENGSQPTAGRRSGFVDARFLTTTFALLLAVATATWLALRANDTPIPNGVVSHGNGRMFAELVTGVGESRTVRLADGSQLRLEPGTRIAVRLQHSLRLLELERGQARFEVAHELRPFVVHAGGGEVIARGTIFDVGLGSDAQVTVRLVQGVVDVTMPSTDPVRVGRRQLHAGEALRFAARRDAMEPTTPQAATGAAPSDPERARDYDGIRVADLVGAANRTGSRPIRLAEPEIGRHRVSGRFRIDDTNLLAERIAGLFGLRVDRSDATAIVLRPR